MSRAATPEHKEGPRSTQPGLPSSAPSSQQSALVKLWTRSFTSVRLDLRRPQHTASAAAKRPRRRRLVWSNRDDSEDVHVQPRVIKLGPLDFSSATLGVMQMLEAGPIVPVAAGKRQRRVYDAGVGVVYDAATGDVQPSARLRLRLPLPLRPDAVVRAAPNAELCLKLNLPLSVTGLRLGVRLALPWTNEQFDAVMTGAKIPWRPVFSCRLFSGADRGLVHFSTRGVELAEQSLNLGADTVLRCAASVDFPSSWPVQEGDDLRLRLEKLAIKTSVRYN